MYKVLTLKWLLKEGVWLRLIYAFACFSVTIMKCGHFLKETWRGTSNEYPHMSLVVRKPEFCICENKDADQLHSNCAADQRLCFRYIDSTIPLLSKSEISSF